MSDVDGLRTLRRGKARELCNRTWDVEGTVYRFADMDRSVPNVAAQDPWREGREGYAFPLLGASGQIEAYAKFFNRLSVKRYERTRWLIDEGVHAWSRELLGAPCEWLDTRDVGPPDGCDVHFACSLSRAVPGTIWLSVKEGIARLGLNFTRKQRLRAVTDLVRALAVLERSNLVHGDLSPENLVLNLGASDKEPLLCLVDFDAFYASAAGDVGRLSAGEGGVIGTKDYMPIDLTEAVAQNKTDVGPYSDRYARDMLMVEILCYEGEDSHEEPLPQWDRGRIDAGLREHENGVLNYLRSPDLFAMAEGDRPSSGDLARSLALTLPPRVKRASRTKPFTGTPPPRGAPTAAPAQPTSQTWAASLLQQCNALLWLLCTGMLFAGSLLLGSKLFGGARAEGAFSAGWFVGLAGMALVVTGCVLPGSYWLATKTFAEDRTQIIQLGRFGLEIPARYVIPGEELAVQQRVTAILVAVLLVLLVGCFLLTRW